MDRVYAMNKKRFLAMLSRMNPCPLVPRYPGTQVPRLRYPIACISGFAVVAYLPRLA